MHRFALAAVFCSAVLAPSPLGAQTYPSKPLHLILPYVPGGIIDTAGRNLARRRHRAASRRRNDQARRRHRDDARALSRLLSGLAECNGVHGSCELGEWNIRKPFGSGSDCSARPLPQSGALATN